MIQVDQFHASFCCSVYLTIEILKKKMRRITCCPGDSKIDHINEYAALTRALTEEFELVLKLSLNGQSLQDAAQESTWCWFDVLSASMTQV